MRSFFPLIVLLLSACGGSQALRRPVAEAPPTPALVPLATAPSPVQGARIEALGRGLLAQRGWTGGEGARALHLDLVRWELPAGTRELRSERWADDGGATRMALERLSVRELQVELVPRLAPPRSPPLEPVRLVLPVQLGPGRDERVRVRGEVEPVLLLRGSEAEVMDRGMRLALERVLDQLAPPAAAVGGGAIPLAAGGPAQAEALRLARAGDLVAAESLLRAAVAVDPADAAAAYNLAAVLDAQGRYDEALRWYGTALALRPDDGWQATAAACEAAAAAGAL